MNKQDFINNQIKKLKELMYKDDPEIMSEQEENILRKFLEEFISDLKEVAKKQ